MSEPQTADTEPTPAESPADSAQPQDSGTRSLDKILKMNVPVIVKIAQKQMSVQDVLRLNIGSVVQFDKDAYEHVDLMVNNSVVGLGQPVKIGENFGLRIIQIGELNDMIRSLGGAQDSSPEPPSAPE